MAFLSELTKGLSDALTNTNPLQVRAATATQSAAMPIDLIGANGYLSVNLLGRSQGTRNLMAAANENPNLNAAISIIASSLAAVPWYLEKQQTKSGQKKSFAHMSNAALRRKAVSSNERIDNHPFLDFLDAGNPIMPGAQGLALSYAYEILVGEYFWAILRGNNGKGDPVGFIVIPPHWVSSVPLQSGKDYYELSFGTGHSALKISSSNMVWYYNPKLLDPYSRGAGAGESLKDELDTDEYASQLLRHLLANKGFIDMLVGVAGSSTHQLERLEAQYNQRRTGPQNAGRGLFFSADKFKIAPVTHALQELRLLDLRRFSFDVVQTTLHIPPELFGKVDNSNRATITGAETIFAKRCMVPRLTTQRSFMQAYVLPMFSSGVGYTIEYENPVPADNDFTLDVMSKAPMQAFTLNDWRYLAGLSKESWGDVQAGPQPPPTSTDDDGFGSGSDSDSDSDDNSSQTQALQKVQQSQLLKATPKIIPTDEQLRMIEAFLELLNPNDLSVRLSPIWQREVRAIIIAELGRFGVDAGFEVYNPLVADYIEEFAGERIVGINDTTRQQIRHALIVGVENGDGIDTIAASVRDVMQRIPAWRAQAIARTEVTRAASFGAQAAWEATGLALKRTWIATIDNDVRPAHLALNNTDKGLNEPWHFDGSLEPHVDEDVMLPTLCSATNAVNCRCAVAAYDPEHASGAKAFDNEDDLNLFVRATLAKWDAWEADAVPVIIDVSASQEDKLIATLLASDIVSV